MVICFNDGESYAQVKYNWSRLLAHRQTALYINCFAASTASYCALYFEK